MLDHLLPLIYREYENLDDNNKENFGYVVNRCSRPTPSKSHRTPPRPPRRNRASCSGIKQGVMSTSNLKRRREGVDDRNTERKRAKKQEMMTKMEKPTVYRTRRRKLSVDESDEREHIKKKAKVGTVIKKKKLIVDAEETKEEAKPAVNDEDQISRGEEKQEERVTPGKVATPAVNDKDQISRREEEQGEERVTPGKVAQEEEKLSKPIENSKRQTKATVDDTKTVKVSKHSTPKRKPLQDITHLYVHGRTRLYEYQRRERSVARLSTSVAIRFF